MSDEQTQRTNVLLAALHSKVDTLVEGQTELFARSDRHEARFDQMDARFDRLEWKVDAIAGDVSVLKTDVAVLKSDMADVRGRLGRVEHHIGLNGAKPSKRKSTRKPKR